MVSRTKLLRLSLAPPALWLAWLLPVFAWAPLTYPGYFEFWNGFAPIFNLTDLSRHGVDLAWAPAIGQGYDLLRGEGAFPYWLAGLARTVLPAMVAVKVIFGASILAGGLGMFAWARRRLSPWAALLASAAYVFWPAGLATVYVRGAFAEAVLLGLLPWLLWLADRALATSGWLPAAGLALGLAAALRTQTGLALWWAALLLAYLLLTRPRDTGAEPVEARMALRQAQGLREPGAGRAHALVGWAAGLLLGLLTLLPVYLARGVGGMPVDFAAHLLSPYDLLSRSPVQMVQGAGGPEMAVTTMDPLLVSQVGLVAGGLALLGLVLRRRGPAPAGGATAVAAGRQAILAGCAVALLLFLTLSWSGWLWRVVPVLSGTLTYPWQSLLLAGPWLAWLAGLGGQALWEMWPADRRDGAAVPFFAGLLALVLLGVYGDLNPRPAAAIPPDQPLAVYGQNQVALLRAEVVKEAGATVTVRTEWQALRPLDQDYTVFVHAVGPDGTVWGQHDTMPRDGQYPTSQWRPGEVVSDQYQVALKPGAPAGDYRYYLGWYAWQTGQRLPAGSDDKLELRDGP